MLGVFPGITWEHFVFMLCGSISGEVRLTALQGVVPVVRLVGSLPFLPVTGVYNDQVIVPACARVEVPLIGVVCRDN